MATDGRALHYGPAFVLGLSPDERVGVLAHEALHRALVHPYRRGNHDPERWNIACDLAINPLLLQAGFVLPMNLLLPGVGMYASFVPFQSADAYYHLFNTAPLPNPSSGSGAGTARTPQPDLGGCGQVLDPPANDPATHQEQEAEWAVALVQAQQAAHTRGPLPLGLGRTVQETIHPPTDWPTLLRAFVAQHARNDYSWLRPNRRLLSRGLYLPGLHSEELGDVVIAVDTSGSISAELLNRFASEVQAILEAYSCTVALLYHDTHIQGVQTWASTDGPLHLHPVGGGGTDHTCVFEWLAEQGTCPACVICLTDLETTFPDDVPDVPVLWAVHGALRAAPFGLVVALTPST